MDFGNYDDPVRAQIVWNIYLKGDQRPEDIKRANDIRETCSTVEELDLALDGIFDRMSVPIIKRRGEDYRVK